MTISIVKNIPVSLKAHLPPLPQHQHLRRRRNPLGRSGRPGKGFCKFPLKSLTLPPPHLALIRTISHLAILSRWFILARESIVNWERLLDCWPPFRRVFSVCLHVHAAQATQPTALSPLLCLCSSYFRPGQRWSQPSWITFAISVGSVGNNHSIKMLYYRLRRETTAQRKRKRGEGAHYRFNPVQLQDFHSQTTICLSCFLLFWNPSSHSLCFDLVKRGKPGQFRN